MFAGHISLSVHHHQHGQHGHAVGGRVWCVRPPLLSTQNARYRQLTGYNITQTRRNTPISPKSLVVRSRKWRSCNIPAWQLPLLPVVCRRFGARTFRGRGQERRQISGDSLTPQSQSWRATRSTHTETHPNKRGMARDSTKCAGFGHIRAMKKDCVIATRQPDDTAHQRCPGRQNGLYGICRRCCARRWQYHRCKELLCGMCVLM